MVRAPCCDKNGLKKGPWTPEEDQKLIDYIQKHGYGKWRTLPKNAGLQRCGKSCRLRWTNYLKPDIKRGRFSLEEEETIIHLHSILGNKWSAIAARLPGRTDNEIKNYWNTQIRKKLLRMGIDPLDLPRLLAFQPLVNPELPRLATSVLYNQRGNDRSFISHQNGQQNQLSNDLQVQNEYHHPLVQANQLQEVPTCTTLTATYSDFAAFSDHKTQLTEPKVPSNTADQSCGLHQEWLNDNGSASNSTEDIVFYNSCYKSHDETGILDPSTYQF